MTYDVAIVGAGPAGLAVAIGAAYVGDDANRFVVEVESIEL